MKEVWKAVPGWENDYEVSNLGGVRSIDRYIVYEDGRVRRFPAKTLAQQSNPAGYVYVGFSHKPRAQRFAVHQLVMLAFEGPCPEGYEVCHNNGVKDDCSYDNLHYGTRKMNVAETYEQRFNFNAGTKNYKAKLTLQQVTELRKTLRPWMGKRLSGGIGVKLAQLYGVSKSLITELHQGKRYGRETTNP